MADSSRITVDDVSDEIERLKRAWNPSDQQSTDNILYKFLPKEQVENLDTFDANQLNYVLDTCQRHNSMASAGRELFDVSRTLKSQPNDSSRLQKYLSKFGVKWGDISQL